MKHCLLFILSFCFCVTLSAQCQFGHRYSDLYLNIKKQNKPGDSSRVFVFANGSASFFILQKIDRDNNYQYRRDAGYLSMIKIKFDSLGKVSLFYYKYNSGFWGSAGHGTEFVSYYGNGNLKTSGWIEKKVGQIRFYDALDHTECEAKKLTQLREVDCVKFRSQWYVLLGKHPELKHPGFFKRRKLIRTNKNNLRRIQINWKDGFKIDDAVVQEITGKS